jgi:hypothetical protein
MKPKELVMLVVRRRADAVRSLLVGLRRDVSAAAARGGGHWTYYDYWEPSPGVPPRRILPAARRQLAFSLDRLEEDNKNDH